MVKWLYGRHKTTSTGNSRQGTRGSQSDIRQASAGSLSVRLGRTRSTDPDSDIDIAIVLDKIQSRFEEHERTGDLASEISLQYNTLVSFFFVPQCNYEQGKYSTYRAIKREGIAV